MSGSPEHFLQDTDKVMDAFYEFCFLAGPDNCAFFKNSPEEIETRLNLLLTAIKKEPVIVPALSHGEMPAIITYSGLRRMQFRALYQPLLLFPSLADALAGLELRNGSQFMQFLGPQFQDLFTCDTPDLQNPQDSETENTADASPAIMCSDGALLNDTVDDLQDYVNGLLNTSKAAGAVMASFKLSCVGWRVEAKWRYTGIYSLILCRICDCRLTFS